MQISARDIVKLFGVFLVSLVGLVALIALGWVFVDFLTYSANRVSEEKQLMAMRDERKSIHQEISKTDACIEDLKRRQRSIRQELGDAQEKKVAYDALKKDYDATRKASEELAATLAKQQSDLNVLQHQTAGAKKILDETNAEVDRRQKEVETLQAKKATLQGVSESLAEKQAELKTLRESLKAEKLTRDEIVGEKHAASESLSKSKAMMDAVSVKKQAEEERYAELQKLNDRLKAENKQMTEEQLRLAELIAKAKPEAKALELRRKTLAGDYAGMQEAVRQVTAEWNNVKKSITEQETVLARAKVAHATINETLEQLNEKLSSRQRYMEGLEKRIASAEAEEKSAEQRRKAALRQVEVQEARVEELKAEVDGLNNLVGTLRQNGASERSTREKQAK